MTRYALIAALLAALGLSGWLMLERARVAGLRAENERLELALTGCEVRSANIIEDKETDDAVDRLPDSDLRIAPERWMYRDEGGAR